MSLETVVTTQQWILDSLKETIIKANPEFLWILDHLIFLHVGGSRLYGIHNKSSDWDIRGVVISPKTFWVGARNFELFEGKDHDKNLDFVIYDVRKWLNLTVACNPNVVETLFAEANPESEVLTSGIWRRLQSILLGSESSSNDNEECKRRNLHNYMGFLNQRAYVGYRGYADAQLKKMVIKHGNKTGRRDIVDEYGFDVKFASHGFRLARQGAELLRTGKITFPRPDREELKEIKYGQKYGPNDLDKCIADLELAQKDLDKALEETILPKKTDFEAYNQLLENTYDQYVHNVKGE